ncbi:hypothetical protein EQV77_01485 [Halobacillus fulvus]|nr:hypothetical protein EQV77_01485 [Halobacillus fulvus]
MREAEDRERKITDYKRFVLTLIIVSTYLYVGSLISLFEYQTNAYLYMLPLSSLFLLIAYRMILKIRQWQHSKVENK